MGLKCPERAGLPARFFLRRRGRYAPRSGHQGTPSPHRARARLARRLPWGRGSARLHRASGPFGLSITARGSGALHALQRRTAVDCGDRRAREAGLLSEPAARIGESETMAAAALPRGSGRPFASARRRAPAPADRSPDLDFFRGGARDPDSGGRAPSLLLPFAAAVSLASHGPILGRADAPRTVDAICNLLEPRAKLWRSAGRLFACRRRNGGAMTWGDAAICLLLLAILVKQISAHRILEKLYKATEHAAYRPERESMRAHHRQLEREEREQADHP